MYLQKYITPRSTSILLNLSRNCGTDSEIVMNSEMTTKKSDEQNKSQMSQEQIEQKGHVPMNRAGSDEEMAQGVLFLMSNKYVDGQIIAIDGGVLLEVPGS